jgi:hypothetical protein
LKCVVVSTTTPLWFEQGVITYIDVQKSPSEILLLAGYRILILPKFPKKRISINL